MNIIRSSSAKNLIYLLTGQDRCSTFRSENNLLLSIKLVDELNDNELLQLRGLQGRLASSYLRWRYGRNGSRLLMVRKDGALVHVQWIVSGKSIGRRYAFMSPVHWAIISCLTVEGARGLGIYPWALQAVMQSGISNQYLIWAEEGNIASLKGIEKAGGKYVTSFIKTKQLYGLVSRIVYNGEKIGHG